MPLPVEQAAMPPLPVEDPVPTPLLSVEEAQARLLAQVAPLPVEPVALGEANGRRLAAVVVARHTQPPSAVSAMDGYAIRWDDRAGPWRLIGEAAAGRGFAQPLGAGEAVRIFTGATLPAGADTVVVQEDATRDGDGVILGGGGPPRRGAHVRPAGLDFAAGDVVGIAGDTVTPARIGLFAAAGHATVPLHRRPRVVLLATGDELVPPGTTPGRDQIVSANGVMLAALLAAAGAVVVDGGIVADDRDALAAALLAHAGADLLVTIGGASVGDHDHVVPVLRAIGATIDFWKVALRPGKPMLAGRLGDAGVVGLPGNPVSAFVCAQLFVVPMLRRMQGAEPLPQAITARLGAPLAANDARRDYLRAVLSGDVVTAASRQDSSMLRTLADSNVLIDRAPFAPAAAAGDRVACIRLDSPWSVA